MNKLTCSVDGCNRASRAKGMCDAHYRQKRKGQEPGLFRFQVSAQSRFWVKVNKDAPGGCWEWMAAIGTSGYGQFKLDGRMRHSHLVSWDGPMVPSQKECSSTTDALIESASTPTT